MKNVTLISVLLLILIACKQQAPIKIPQYLDAQLRTNAQEHNIPAQAVMVLHNGNVLYSNTTGFTKLAGNTQVTSKTVFPIFSVSKLFASIIAMLLHIEGKLDLSAPASSYLSNLPLSWQNISVQQFLNHASGVPEYYDSDDFLRPFPLSKNDAFTKLTDIPLRFAPGQNTRYTQSNYLVIASVLEAVTKKNYRMLVTERIIVPLGLNNTWLDINDVPNDRVVQSYSAKNGVVVSQSSIPWPEYSIVHGGIYATLDDVGVFMSAVAQGSLVSKDDLKRFWQPYLLTNGDLGYFASGWDYAKSGRWHEVGHDGGTKIRTRILFDESLDDHYVIIYLTNGNKDDVWSRTLVDSVQSLILPE
jgi:D-alanyl-D-alanine carboxypeptidase